ncbi:hypothetical protein SteCoe_25607 [Stentor coeruleus]|uniref:Uncharacterized protein n=1 Tax=Stentor coeruleus TaxID=5963 RepID=A0A1R2BEW7_9CILI|nr:hypothetical protein SteCoe_25607 [Stentor coeruleus]
MNYYITNEEYDELSAKIDASLENISYSDSDEKEEQQQIPEYIPVSSSIMESANWKRFIELGQQNEKDQLLLSAQFTEALSDLREATNDAKISIPEEETMPQVLVEIQENPEFEDSPKISPKNSPKNTVEFEFPSQEKSLKNSESDSPVIHWDIQKLKEENERSQMAEEDMISQLVEQWTKKEQILKKEEQKKDQKRKQEIEKKKAEREKILKEQEEIRLKKERKEKKRQEKLRIENLRKAEERKKELTENFIMRKADEESRLYRESLKILQEKQNISRENRLMKFQDQFSQLYRDLVPIKKSQGHVITETSSYSLPNFNKKSYPTTLSFPEIYIEDTNPSLSQSFKSLPLPKAIIIEKIPNLGEDIDTLAPTLKDFFPYPLDSKSKSLEVKHEEIRSISGLSYFSNLQVLVLSLNKISKINNLPSTLLHLDLSQNQITSIPDLNLPRLEELILDLNQITQISGLKNCVNLRTVSLNNNKISSITGLEKCGLLEKLLLYRNNIEEIVQSTFSPNPYITFLDLGRNKLTSVNFLGPLHLIKSLLLYHNQISSIQKLNQPLLQELWLSGNSLKNLDFIVSCPLLETLRLEDNAINLIIPYNCPVLKYFNISFNNIQTFADVLLCIKGCRNLVSFSFNDNPLLNLHLDLISFYNETIVKALPSILELNNTGRTSLEKPFLYKGSLARKAFELHQIDVFLQKNKRKNEVVRYVKQEMKELLMKIPAKVYGILEQECEFNTKGVEYFWYEARKDMYIEIKAILVIQTWWKYVLFKKYRIIKRYSGFIEEIVKIQSVYRGYKARKSCKNLRYNPKKIVKIQALYRGYNLRKKMKKALDNAKMKDLDLDEFKEVNLDDIDMNYDFQNELIIPKNLDLKKFLQNPPIEETKTPKLPPLKPPSQPKPQGNLFNRSVSGEKSLQTSTQSSLPPLHKNKTKEEMEKHLDEWGFTNNDVKEALQYRMLKNIHRKSKNKHLTADERLEKFRKISRK